MPIQLQYGGSQTLLASIEISKRGDLYLLADESYLARKLADKVFLLKEGIVSQVPLDEFRGRAGPETARRQ